MNVLYSNVRVMYILDSNVLCSNVRATDKTDRHGGWEAHVILSDELHVSTPMMFKIGARPRAALREDYAKCAVREQTRARSADAQQAQRRARQVSHTTHASKRER